MTTLQRGSTAEPQNRMKRIQRQRMKGWRMPPNTVYVGRPSRWGNPYPFYEWGRTRWQSVAMYRIAVQDILEYDPEYLAPLRGKNLACWCPLDEPCHADALLELVA